jgi:hypothetical protein
MQLKTNNNKSGEERRGKLGLHALVKEIYLLARAIHYPGSGFRNERWLMSLEEEDDGRHGEEVRDMQKPEDMCRSSGISVLIGALILRPNCGLYPLKQKPDFSIGYRRKKA